MAQKKMSVTVPLTARQKEQIKRATGKTIASLRVESAGGASLKPRVSLARPGLKLTRGIHLKKGFQLTRGIHLKKGFQLTKGVPKMV
jgi:hypothetical protein